MKRRPLLFSPDLALPLDAVTQTFAFMAKRGAGKTYGAGKLAEEMLRVGAQVIVLDPVGNWYGLRLGADGKSPGFEIPLFGGATGDIPLEPGSGRLVAKYVVERGISLVLDVSRFRKGPQRTFVTDFIEELYELKKDEPSAMHLIIEEAQRFCPQTVWSGGERLLGAMEDIIKLGRNYGIGISLLSQRPQSVHKDCLNQTEVLICLQTSGKQERKAIKDWIVEKEIEGKPGTNLDELPGLQIGEAFVWSPQWLGILQKIHIGTKMTFNASATPKVGEKRKPPRPLIKEDLARLRMEMQEMVAVAEANDPKHLKAEIVKLKAELAKKAKDHVVQAPPKTVEKVVEKRIPVLTDKEREKLRLVLSALQGLDRLWSDFDKSVTSVMRTLPEANRVLDKLDVFAKETVVATPSGPVKIGYDPNKHPVVKAILREAEHKINTAPLPRPEKITSPPLEDEDVKELPTGGAKRILLVLGQRYALDEKRLSKKQLAMLSGYKASGGSFNTYLSFLRSHGYIEGSTDLKIQLKGIEFLGALPEVPGTTEELVELWASKLEGRAKVMLKHLVDIYPNEISKIDLAEIAGMDASGGSFNTYLSKIRATGLATSSDRGRTIRASESLFL